MKLIIDTDAGIDDAIALLMVLAYPQAQIEAITTVVGNVSLAQATHNVGVILNVVDAPDIPIYQGCASPLLQYTPQDAAEIHATDGLGGMSRSQPGRPVQPRHASLALIQLARRRSGQLALLTLGPLTNIALAIRLEPQLLNHFNRLIIMGGAVDGRGNTTPPTEFNIGVDPEAAKIVFDSCSRLGLQAELVSWETTLAHPLKAEAWDELIAGQTDAAKFMQGMTAHIRQVLEHYGFSGLLWPDPLAAAVALAPEIVDYQEARWLQVACGNSLTRGQTVVDYRPRSRQPANTRIIRRINPQQFQKLLQMAVHH